MWSVVYKRAEYEDGTLLFPERLTKDFLRSQRKVMGSYLYANQYLNEVIPDDARVFRSEWLSYWDTLPSRYYNFAFVDPAIGQNKHHDFTGIAIISASRGGVWHGRVLSRYRLTPTQIVAKLFDIQEEFKCRAIGIESVAYQEALLYILDEEMRRRNKLLPVKGIKRSSQTKESRILGLVPRFEWKRMFLPKGCSDFEDEYTSFPRAKHDDILDALASLEEIVHYPEEEKPAPLGPAPSVASPDYERWYIRSLTQSQGRGSDDE